MSKKTKEYKYLLTRIRRLEKNFDFQQNSRGISHKQEDHLKGFRLLCHAEFEDYFESIALRIFDESVDVWKKKNIANFQIASFFVEHERIESSDNTLTKSFQIIQYYKKNIIDTNHGIKEQNIKKMYAPLGFEMKDFDPILFAELDSFGKDRGESAHSSEKHTSVQLDKDTEFARVERLLGLIENFEQVIRNKYSKL